MTKTSHNYQQNNDINSIKSINDINELTNTTSISSLLESMTIQQLWKIMRKSGVNYANRMTKKQMISDLTSSLLGIVEGTSSQEIVKDMENH